MDVIPVRADSMDDLVNSVVKVANIEDPLEELHAVTLRSGENVWDRVAVNTVGADVRELSSKLVKVGVDLVSGLAGSIGVVWGVGNSETVSATWVLSDGVRDDVLVSSWCWSFLDGCWWFVVSNCDSQSSCWSCGSNWDWGRLLLTVVAIINCGRGRLWGVRSWSWNDLGLQGNRLLSGGRNWVAVLVYVDYDLWSGGGLDVDSLDQGNNLTLHMLGKVTVVTCMIVSNYALYGLCRQQKHTSMRMRMRR